MIHKFVNLRTHFSILSELKEPDIEQIINIRNKRKNNFLYKISDSIEEQIVYFRSYKKRQEKEGEIYYKLYDKNQPNTICGLVRIVKIYQIDSFSWESFILKEGTNPILAYDVPLTIFSIGFDFLKKKTCGPWNVPLKANNIMKFHKNIGMASVIDTTNQFYVMSIEYDNYIKRKNFFQKKKIGIILK